MDALGAFGAVRADFEAHYELEAKTLGTGVSSEVRWATSIHGRRGLAVKCFKKDAVEGMKNPKFMENLSLEVRVLVALQGHPNIVKFHGLFEVQLEGTGSGSPSYASSSSESTEGTPNCLALELLSSDLFGTLPQDEWFSEVRARSIVRDTLAALGHMHAVGFVHRDVKPANLMLRRGGACVLVDFGLACALDDPEGLLRCCGSPGFCAPEVIRKAGCSGKSDVFSVGATLFMMLCGRPAFGSGNHRTMFRKTVFGEIEFEYLDFEQVSGACKDFIRELLIKSPDERPAPSAALEHQWMQNKRDRQSMRMSMRSRRSTYASGSTGSWRDRLPRVQQSTQLQGSDLAMSARSSEYKSAPDNDEESSNFISAASAGVPVRGSGVFRATMAKVMSPLSRHSRPSFGTAASGGDGSEFNCISPKASSTSLWKRRANRSRTESTMNISQLTNAAMAESEGAFLGAGLPRAGTAPLGERGIAASAVAKATAAAEASAKARAKEGEKDSIVCLAKQSEGFGEREGGIDVAGSFNHHERSTELEKQEALDEATDGEGFGAPSEAAGSRRRFIRQRFVTRTSPPGASAIAAIIAGATAKASSSASSSGAGAAAASAAANAAGGVGIGGAADAAVSSSAAALGDKSQSGDEGAESLVSPWSLAHGGSDAETSASMGGGAATAAAGGSFGFCVKPPSTPQGASRFVSRMRLLATKDAEVSFNFSEGG